MPDFQAMDFKLGHYQPPLPSATEKEFARGVVYACARLVEMYDQPTMADAILRESGVDVRCCDEYDVAFLRKENPKLPKGIV